MAKTQPDDPEQFARFKKAAKEAGLDDDPKALEPAFNRIVPPKSAPQSKPAK